MKVSICVGSSCHLKGSYAIIQKFQEAVATHHLEQQVTLAAAFCVGHCTKGVSVEIDGHVIEGFTSENFDQLFQQHILEVLPKN